MTAWIVLLIVEIILSENLTLRPSVRESSRIGWNQLYATPALLCPKNTAFVMSLRHKGGFHAGKGGINYMRWRQQ